jgi:hypothetical protein
MTLPVFVESHEGWFAASLAGAPDVRGVAATRDEAVAALESQLAEKVAHGELFSLDVPESAVVRLAGRFADDPCLRDICSEAYRERDAEAH